MIESIEIAKLSNYIGSLYADDVINGEQYDKLNNLVYDVDNVFDDNQKKIDRALNALNGWS